MECLTFTDENGLQKSVVRDDTHVSRKRKSTRRSSIIPSSQREPLADVQLASTGVAVEGMALEDPQCQGQVMQPSSDRRTYESVGNYCSFLRSIMDNDMYAKVEQNVLSGLPEGCSVDVVELNVTRFLEFGCMQQTFDFCEMKDSIPTARARRKKRRTADRVIMQAGLLLTPSPKSRVRRSRRIRNSLSVHKEQEHCDEIGSHSDDIMSITDINEAVPPPADAPVIPDYLDNLQLSPDSLHTADASACISDKTFIVEEFEALGDTPAEDDDDYAPSQQLVDLYTNRNFTMPLPRSFSTIFESPRKYRGVEQTFSKPQYCCCYDFSEGHWYRPPEGKLKQRARKARLNGWRERNAAVHDSVAIVLEQKLLELDLKMMGDSN